jgi:hypothetical protein
VDAIRRYIDHGSILHKAQQLVATKIQQYITVCLIQLRRNKVQEMRGLVLQLSTTERGSHRQKRGFFNLVGHVAHSLFGMLDSDTEDFTTKKFLRGAVELA